MVCWQMTLEVPACPFAAALYFTFWINLTLGQTFPHFLQSVLLLIPQQFSLHDLPSSVYSGFILVLEGLEVVCSEHRAFLH